MNQCSAHHWLCILACCFWSSRDAPCPSIKVRMKNGRPSPRVSANIFDPMILDIAMSSNLSLATRIEQMALWEEQSIEKKESFSYF